MPRISILQLEDSDLDAELELSHLHRAGMELRSRRVRDRAEFTTALENETFDVILADFHLPGFNGLEALSITREKAPRTPFIFVSGVLGEETAIDSLRNGATDYVLKIRMERLVPAVQRAISEAAEHAERLRMQFALAESENRFSNMADFAPVMIWATDRDKRWSYCNRRWLEFTGLSVEQSSGSGWSGLVHPQDRAQVLEAYDRAFETHREFTLEYRLRRCDGEYRAIVNRAVPRAIHTDIQKAGDESAFAGFIGSCTDVSELKAAEERLRHAAKLESLGILAGGIAHDFNNLLTGILGNASLLLESLPPGSAALPCVEEVVQASEAAAQLTRQMLGYAGKSQFLPEPVDFSRAVRETLPLIAASVPRMVNLSLQLGHDLPAIEADPGQIQQLVMNLVINAAEAAGNGKAGVVTISTGLEELDEAAATAMLSSFPVAPGRYVVLRVKDNGPGMDSDTKNRIFDPFFSTKFAGRGLGLAAISGIVRGHKGGIALESEPGKGADFRVYLRVSSGGRQSPAGPKVKRAGAAGTGTILVVDDQAVVNRVLRLMLERHGYSVLSAKDGEEAVELYRAHASSIDLVLLDMDMPVRPGDIAFKQIRAIRPDARVIATSGFNEAEALRRFGNDLDGFIQKPYGAIQLAEKVQSVISRPQPQGR